MREPAWKRLIRDLTDQGYESPYLDRLRNRLDLEQAHHELEKEILQEMASALGRAEEKVCLALLQLELVGREVNCLMEVEERPEGWIERVNARIADFNRQRSVAKESLWELVIHREAIGLRRNEILRRFYPIPPEKEPILPASKGAGALDVARPTPTCDDTGSSLTPLRGAGEVSTNATARERGRVRTPGGSRRGRSQGR